MITIDPENQETFMPGLFAGGDVGGAPAQS